MRLDAMFLFLGFSFWWLIFGVECWVNGAHGGLELPFVEWFRELRWNLPFVGWKYRLEFTSGDEKWAMALPGPIHFLCEGCLMPLLPWLAYRAVLSLFY